MSSCSTRPLLPPPSSFCAVPAFKVTIYHEKPLFLHGSGAQGTHSKLRAKPLFHEIESRNCSKYSAGYRKVFLWRPHSAVEEGPFLYHAETAAAVFLQPHSSGRPRSRLLRAKPISRLSYHVAFDPPTPRNQAGRGCVDYEGRINGLLPSPPLKGLI